MNIHIEKMLQQYPSHIIDYATLSTILTNSGYVGIKSKINSLKKQGFLETLKRGLYLHKSPFSNNGFSKEIIANTLLSPSYISFDYALYFYGLIPESVHDVSCTTTKRSKTFKTKSGTYTFKHIKKELFSLGLQICSNNSGNFLMASKEKALCDKVYFTKNIQITSKKQMLEFLLYDLRVDMDELQGCNMDIFKHYFAISKSKKIEILTKVIKESL